MKGKVALVTGAVGGLGKFVTRALLDRGATVVGVSRKIQQSDFDSPQFTAIAGELSDAAAADRIVKQALAQFGKLDVLAHLVGGVRRRTADR